MKTTFFRKVAFATLLAFAMFFVACQKTDSEALHIDQKEKASEVTDRANGNSKVFPPNAHPYGQSYQDWAQLWLEQFYANDCASLPFLNPGYELFYTEGPAYMVAGIAEPGASADFTVRTARPCFSRCSTSGSIIPVLRNGVGSLRPAFRLRIG